HAFTADVAGDGGVLVLAADLVDLIYIDDAGLGAAHVAVGRLEQLEDDVLDVLANVAGFSERGGVDDGEGNVKHAGQRLCQQGLARAGGPDQHDVGLCQLHVPGLGAVHVDALVVVVNRHGKFFLGLLLADHVFVEERLDFLRLGQVIGSGSGMGFTAVVFQNGIADGNALIANVGPGIIARGRNKLGHGVLRLVAKRTTKCLFWRPRLHANSLVEQILFYPASGPARDDFH